VQLRLGNTCSSSAARGPGRLTRPSELHPISLDTHFSQERPERWCPT
jgi:hypothetical protein